MVESSLVTTKKGEAGDDSVKDPQFENNIMASSSLAKEDEQLDVHQYFIKNQNLTPSLITYKKRRR